AVVVEGMEHAGEMQKLLPHLPIVRAYPPEPIGWQPQAIVTLAALEEHDCFAPTAIVNAVGGRFMVPLADDFDACPPDHPAVVIERDDMFDDVAVRSTTNRLRQYAFRRWPVYPPSVSAPNPQQISTKLPRAQPASGSATEASKSLSQNPCFRRFDSRDEF